MAELTNREHRRTNRHHWRRDTVELSAVFMAVALADLIANVVVHGHDGPVLLVASALALLATAAWHSWWKHRHPDPPGPAPGDIVSSAASEAAPLPALSPHSPHSPLWRIRTTVPDAPGSLAGLCRALADLPVNIISMQAHPLAEETVDEFVVQAHQETAAQDITRAVVAAGGTEVWLERADAHDLVDVPTRILNLATRTALDAAELPLALRQLFGRCTIRHRPAEAGARSPATTAFRGGTGGRSPENWSIGPTHKAGTAVRAAARPARPRACQTRPGPEWSWPG